MTWSLSAWLNSCGPRALRAAIRADGGPRASLGRLMALSGADGRGASLDGLRRAAQALGFEAGAWRTDYNGLLRLRRPFIAHLRHGHWIPVKACGAAGAELAGGAAIPRLRFERDWSGAILTLHPPFDDKEDDHV